MALAPLPDKYIPFQSTPSAWRETTYKSKAMLAGFAFQSTPSAWRETKRVQRNLHRNRNFNPLPPHGGRQVNQVLGGKQITFQSTPSAWRETSSSRSCSGACRKFQSTPSAWRETRWWNRNCPVSVISIHSLRMEGDYKCAIIYTEVRDFNPLPPHGGRLRWVAAPGRFGNISIHSLRMEGDIFSPFPFRKTEEFQSTPSAWRETPILLYTSWVARYFNPLPPHGGRPSHRSSPATPSLFQSTPSAWRETCSRP